MTRSRRRSGLILAFVAFAFVQMADRAGWLTDLDHQLLAACYRLRGPLPPGDEVVVVALDGPEHRSGMSWPPSPRYCAHLVAKLREASAVVVALDLLPLAQTPSEQWPAGEVAMLAQEMRRSGNVVLPAALVAPSEAPKYPRPRASDRFSPGAGQLPTPVGLRGGRLAVPAQELCAAAAGLGQLNIYPDTDGVIRSVPLLTSAEGYLWPSLSLEVLRVYRGLPAGSVLRHRRDVVLSGDQIPVTAAAEMPVNFRGGFRHFPYVSAADVVASDARRLRELVSGKIVLVGPTVAGRTSFWRTPVHPMVPGVEINANAVANLLHRSALLSPSAWVTTAFALLAALLLGWGLPLLSPANCVQVSVGLFGLAFGVPVLFFLHGVWVPMAMPLATVALAGGFLSTQAGVEAERNRMEAETRLQSRLHAIDGVGDLIVSSTDRDQLLWGIVHWVERELEVPAVSILLVDERRRRLVFEVASGEKGEEVKAFTLEIGQGVAGQVALTGEPLIVQEADTDPRQAHDISEAVEYPAESLLCVPMKLHGEVIGVIEAMNKRTGPFTDYDQSLLSVIAHQAALFIESARVYSELQLRVDAATLELRNANRDLAAQKAKIETLVAEMDAGVIATDALDRVVTINPTAERMLGIDGTEAMGEPVLAVVRHAKLSAILAEPLSLHGGRMTDEVEVEHAESGNRLVLRVFVTLFDEAEGGFGKLCLLTDITQLKELDRMKTDVVSFVSHELQSPLTAVAGFAQTIEQRTEPGSPAGQMARHLSHEANRMQWLVQDFLDMARLDSGVALEMRYRDITDLAARVGELMDLQAVETRDHTFELEAPDDLPTVRADLGKLEQVLVNLLTNAVKYSPDGGRVGVAIRPEDGEVLFEVTDEGVGIGPDELPNLFQQYRRTRAARERVRGTGIGLYLSRHLVEAHGGRIWAESGPRGSTFRFTIPLQPPAEEARVADGPTHPA